jgi:hypothetical protein
MKFLTRTRMLLAALLLLLISGGVVLASEYAARQYYSGWHKPAQATYYYRSYYYKPTPTYSGYRHHYVVYYPAKPKYVYYYNPYTRKYWGRCPTESNGEGLYSMLADKDRAASLKEIPETAFPKPSAVPDIPDSTDKAKLDLPPDDLPSDAVPVTTAGAAPSSSTLPPSE